MEQTLSIVKPDGTSRNLIGKVTGTFEENGLSVAAMKMIRMDGERAKGFYAEHSERPFFASLTDFMSSGPCVVMVLRGEDAIAKVRKIMGATNPAEADDGTIRKLHAENVERNVVHGSDSPQSAEREISYFFNRLEIF